MIPNQRLALSLRHATVMSGSLASEKHGDKKQLFLDIKFKFLLEPTEIDEWTGVAAYGLIFDEDKKFRVPGLSQTAGLRDTLKGDLTLEVDGLGKKTIEDAHIVGTVSKLGFKIGGHGEVILQLRADWGKDNDYAFDLIERGDCMMSFEEYDHNLADPKAPDSQESMPV